MSQKFKTLVDMFEQSTEAFKSHNLFGEKRNGTYQWIKYGEFHERVNNLRGGLAQKGLGKGDTVAIISNNSIGWAAAAHACFGLGASFVAMYEAQKDSEWQYIINDCGAKHVFVSNDGIHKKLSGILPELKSVELVINVAGTEGTTLAQIEALGVEKPCPPAIPDPNDIAVLIYTSGTTGNPKGVRLSHANIISNVNAIQALMPMRGGDKSLSFLPWAHSFGSTCELHCLLSIGAAMGLAEDVSTILENLPEVQPTVIFSVPRIFNKIYAGVQTKMEGSPTLVRALFSTGMRLAEDRHSRSLGLFERFQLWLADKIVFSKIRARFGGKLEYAFSGGAAMSRDVAQFIDNLGIVVFEGYGLSETSPIATVNSPGHRKIGSVGKPIPDCRVVIDTSVVEDNGTGEGEIVIYGPNVMQGYLNLPDKTAEVLMADGGFRSGDIGRIDEDGFLFITGRLKEQYKLLNGKYVAPVPIEEQYKLSPLVNQVMVYGFNKQNNVALVVPDKEKLLAWAEKAKYDTSDYGQLLKQPKVAERILKDLEDFGKGIKNYERVRRCALIEEEFGTDNGLLTPTLKLKRRNVLAKYQGVIDKLYDERATQA
ncbi:MAG: long-chain fatty acid--CoA ligase [Planctomycetota bacterium]|nr:long-chain fatty acid--CoA ligase [Planctomycetota bacterium]